MKGIQPMLRRDTINGYGGYNRDGGGIQPTGKGDTTMGRGDITHG